MNSSQTSKAKGQSSPSTESELMVVRDVVGSCGVVRSVHRANLVEFQCNVVNQPGAWKTQGTPIRVDSSREDFLYIEKLTQERSGGVDESWVRDKVQEFNTQLLVRKSPATMA